MAFIVNISHDAHAGIPKQSRTQALRIDGGGRHGGDEKSGRLALSSAAVVVERTYPTGPVESMQLCRES